MSKENPFVLDRNSYKRDLNLLAHYVKDVATCLSISEGRPYEECEAFVKAQLSPTGLFPFKDPTVHYFRRGDNGDRVRAECKLTEYFGRIIREEEIFSATFTTYTSPKREKSLLVEFIDENVAARGRAKKAMFKAKMAKNMDLFFLKKSEQALKKISNNSISGAHVSSSTPLYNKTAHSTLTSGCRSTSGYGNANNEKMLSGNRHYWNPKIAYNNIISIINNTDYDQMSAAMQEFGIRCPTVEETMECISYSTNLYWRNIEAMREIELLVSKLTDMQRAAFVYTGDLYHIAKYNSPVVLKFITELSTAVREECDNPDEVLEAHREEYKVLAMQFFLEEMRGNEINDVKDKPVYKWIASTVKHIHKTIMDYKNFIGAFFVTKNAPASLSFFPDSIRRAALTSDTDSTIFTVQDWVFWKHGENPGFTPETYATEATMIFLAAEAITHVLARMSANIGIGPDRIHQIAMKNEYKFDVFVPTQVGKHYFAYISCQEGNIYDEPDMEIKGVHLKSSNVPKPVMAAAKQMMKDIMNTVMEGKKISLYAMLKRVGDVEREIKRSILAGESTYFRIAQIKTPASYTKSEEESPYQHHIFWEEVMAPKYGPAPQPPYACSKVSVDLGSKTSLREWAEKITDPELRVRLQKWIERTNKNGVQAFLLPSENLGIHGMPKEISDVMDMRRTIFDLSGVMYILLETLGFYCVNKSLTQLVSDVY